jgi:hypothetical protein
MKKNDVLLEEIANFFDSSDDEAWKNWVDFKKPEWRDLYALIAGDARPSIKKRAILILLVPVYNWVPFYWNRSGDNYKYDWCDRKFIETLTPELAEYAADLVKSYYKILINLNQPLDYAHEIIFYNECIIDLLPLLSEEKATELFSHYKINISAFNASTVHRFFGFAMFSDVNIEWKKMADAQLRQMITNKEAINNPEHANNRGRAICGLADTLGAYVECKKPPYDLDLFASQIDFLIDHTKNEKIHYLRTNEKICFLRADHLANYLKIFRSEKYQKLRHKITRYIILHKKDHFRIYSEEMMEAAKMAMEEFEKTDPKLSLKLKAIIKKGEALLAKKKKEAEQKAEAERIKREDILANMR